MIISLVTKYRDFSYLIGFGVQLLMYVSAVVYPMALVAAKCQSTFGWYNPLAYIIEYRAFECRRAFCFGLLYTFMVTMIVF
jgi:lipopolysaccharide transport system permease protein